MRLSPVLILLAVPVIGLPQTYTYLGTEYDMIAQVTRGGVSHTDRQNGTGLTDWTAFVTWPLDPDHFAGSKSVLYRSDSTIHTQGTLTRGITGPGQQTVLSARRVTTFRVENPTTFSLTGGVNLQMGPSFASLENLNTGFNVFSIDETSIAASGTIEAGDYAFVTTFTTGTPLVLNTAHGAAGFFALTLAPVPEPATVVGFAAGSLALLRRRNAKKRIR